MGHLSIGDSSGMTAKCCAKGPIPLEERLWATATLQLLKSPASIATTHLVAAYGMHAERMPARADTTGIRSSRALALHRL